MKAASQMISFMLQVSGRETEAQGVVIPVSGLIVKSAVEPMSGIWLLSLRIPCFWATWACGSDQYSSVCKGEEVGPAGKGLSVIPRVGPGSHLRACFLVCVHSHSHTHTHTQLLTSGENGCAGQEEGFNRRCPEAQPPELGLASSSRVFASTMNRALIDASPTVGFISWGQEVGQKRPLGER